jgi:hypothetical protein
MPTPSFGLTFKVKDMFFDRAIVKAMMDGRTLEALSHAGAMVKVIAQRSMRYVTSLGMQQGAMGRGERTKLNVPLPSAPGEPPHAIRGHSYLRDFLYSGLDRTSRSVVVGPILLSSKSGINVPALHEYGGGVTRKARKAITHQVGGVGPIRVGGRPGMTSHVTYSARGWPVLVTYSKLHTSGQAAAANRIEVELATTSAGVKPGETYIARYLPRPFMAPALEKVRLMLPKFWAAAIQSPMTGAA